MASIPLPKEITSDRIQDTLYAFMRSQILFSALDLDIFSLISDGKNTLETLLSALDVDERGLRILLNGLVGIGFLTKLPNDEYGLPTDVENFLVKASPAYMGGMVHHCKRLYENWSMLSDAVRAGQPVGGAHSLAQLETFFAELVKGLYVSNYPTAQRLASLLGIGQERQGLEILDVAGGSAVWSIAMLEKDSQSRATVLDLPTVVYVAETYVEHHHLAERFTYLPGDLEEMTLPTTQYDVVILANICHALGPIATKKAIQKLSKTLKPDGQLVIVDFVPDDARSKAGWALTFGVNMLITTPEGDVFTHADYERWLQEAGFNKIQAKEVETEVTAIIAERV
jgi:ubiquinone/menaquinone biosynthesis C-methylase UbiE